MKVTDSIIIFGFPGVGKTYACEHAEELGLDLVDSDSSNFHWMKDDKGNYILDENGNKIMHPAWPQNYMNYIHLIGREQEYRPDYIMVSTHNEIMKGIIGMGFDLCISICPSKDKDMKEEFMKLYKERGSSEEFIQNMDKNFDKFVDEVVRTSIDTEEGNVMLIEIRPGGKIQSVYDFLKRKIDLSFIEFKEANDDQ